MTVHLIALILGRAIIHQHTKILLKYVQIIFEIIFYIFQMAVGYHVAAF